jgi:hypothetical protein
VEIKLTQVKLVLTTQVAWIYPTILFANASIAGFLASNRMLAITLLVAVDTNIVFYAKLHIARL